VDLAQLAAMLHPAYTVDVVDAIPGRMTWDEFEKILREKRPRYYVTHVTAPTLTNDLRARSWPEPWVRRRLRLGRT